MFDGDSDGWNGQRATINSVKEENATARTRGFIMVTHD